MTSQELHTQHSVADHSDTEVIMVERPAPVFVDSTGRRRRLLRRFAYGFGAFCMVYGGLISLSLAGGPVSPNAVLPFPDLITGTEGGATEARPSPTPEPAVSAPKSVLVNETTPRRGNDTTWRDGAPTTTRSTSRPSSSSTATPARTVPAAPTSTRAATPRPTEATTTARPAPTTAPPRTATPATPTPQPTPTTTTPPADTGGTGGTGGGAGSVDGEPGDVTTPPAAPSQPVVITVPADSSGDTEVLDTPVVSVTVALPVLAPSGTADDAAPDDAGETAAEVAP